MSKINRRQKQREFFRMQEQLKEKQRKKSKSLNESEGLDKGKEFSSSPGASCEATRGKKGGKRYD